MNDSQILTGANPKGDDRLLSDLAKPTENITIPPDVRREADALRSDLDRLRDITTPQERTYRIALAMENARVQGRIEVRQEHLAETVARVRRMEAANHTDPGDGLGLPLTSIGPSGIGGEYQTETEADIQNHEQWVARNFPADGEGDE